MVPAMPTEGIVQQTVRTTPQETIIITGETIPTTTEAIIPQGAIIPGVAAAEVMEAEAEAPPEAVQEEDEAVADKKRLSGESLLMKALTKHLIHSYCLKGRNHDATCGKFRQRYIINV